MVGKSGGHFCMSVALPAVGETGLRRLRAAWIRLRGWFLGVEFTERRKGSEEAVANMSQLCRQYRDSAAGNLRGDRARLAQ